MLVYEQISRLWLGWIAAASWQLALLVCLVAGIAHLAQKASPRLRHALWLLVLAKAFLPPAMTSPVSIGRWGVSPLLSAVGAWDLDSGIATETDQQLESKARESERNAADSARATPKSTSRLVWRAMRIALA